MSKSFRILLTLVATSLASGVAAAEDLKPVSLPPPHSSGGKPLMDALALRSTSRAFSSGALPTQTLSDLLWAAWGINRPKEGKRTAPSARNWQEIDVYVVMPTGTYLYDATTNTLKPMAAGDQRALAGMQDFVRDAPVTLVFVADMSRVKGAPEGDQTNLVWADAAFISENVYLFAASEGLATGVRASIDRVALAKTLKLRNDQVIAMAQSIGFPKK